MCRVFSIVGADRHFPVDKKMEPPLSCIAGGSICQPGHINCFPTIWPLLAELTATLESSRSEPPHRENEEQSNSWRQSYNCGCLRHVSGESSCCFNLSQRMCRCPQENHLYREPARNEKVTGLNYLVLKSQFRF